jgi:transposase
MNVGLDVHKRMSYYTIMDKEGKVVRSEKISTTRKGLDEFAEILPEKASVALEASTSGLFVYEYLNDLGIEVHLAHPTLVKPFAKKHVSTDKIDSKVLANLLRMNHLPESYVPKGEMRDLRIEVRHRASLVRIRTQIKNKIHALLAQEGIQVPEVTDLFGKAGSSFLKKVELKPPRRRALDQYLVVLNTLNQKIEEISSLLKEKAEITQETKWLMSIPGICFHNALLVQSEIADIKRFKTPQSLVNYAGLAPKVKQSGSYVRYGHINRQSNGFLRWAMIQAARISVRCKKPNKFQRIYHKLKRRRGDKVAIVAVARHIMEAVYWVLSRKENYKDSSSRKV